MGNKLTVVSSPSHFHTHQLGLMLYDVQDDLLIRIQEALLDSNLAMTLFIADSNSDENWIINTSRQADYTIINLEEINLIKGFLLTSPSISYYNSVDDLDHLNTNKIDPLEFVFQIIHDQL